MTTFRLVWTVLSYDDCGLHTNYDCVWLHLSQHKL